MIRLDRTESILWVGLGGWQVPKFILLAETTSYTPCEIACYGVLASHHVQSRSNIANTIAKTGKSASHENPGSSRLLPPALPAHQRHTGKVVQVPFRGRVAPRQQRPYRQPFTDAVDSFLRFLTRARRFVTGNLKLMGATLLICFISAREALVDSQQTTIPSDCRTRLCMWVIKQMRLQDGILVFVC